MMHENPIYLSLLLAIQNSAVQVFYCCVCSMPIDNEDAVVSRVGIALTVELKFPKILEESRTVVFTGEPRQQSAWSLWTRMPRMWQGEIFVLKICS